MAEAELVPPSGEPPKRRLPLVQGHATDQDPEEQDRPPWHWSAIGAVAILLAWLPLIAGAHALSMRLLARAVSHDTAEGVPARVRLAMFALHALALSLAACAGGFLVGRFGGKAGPKEATTAGLLASSLAWALTAAQPQATQGLLIWGLIWIVLASIGTGMAYLGGRSGLKRRLPGA